MYYDSDKQSSNSSSDSQYQQLDNQTKSKLKAQKSIKNAIAYRFQEQQEHKKFTHIFQTWRDFSLFNYRTNIVMAMNHYELKLMQKGFDGIMQYSINSEEFRRKLMMVYYKMLIGQCFESWKSGWKQGKLKVQDQASNESISGTIYKVNQNLDQILKSKYSQNSYKKQTIQLSSYNQKDNEKQKNKGLQLNFLNLIEKHMKEQKYKKLMLSFRCIQNYIASAVNQRNYNKNNDMSKYSNEIVYRDSMINSRRSSNNSYNKLNSLQLDRSKSRRKLAPIVQQVSLPAFGKKSTSEESNNITIIKKHFNQHHSGIKDDSRQLQFRQQRKKREQREIQKERQKQMERIREKERQIERERERSRQRAREIEREKSKERQREREKQRLQKQREKEKEKLKKTEQRNRILSIIAKGKILELYLLQQVGQSQQILRSQKNKSIQLLKKIKLQ